jgi:hypothetical protein
LQSLGIQHPNDWERMMGYPTDWSDARRSETPLCPPPQNSCSEELGT